MATKPETTKQREPLWYKDTVIYELHVKSFCDGNGDGVGDFRGLLSKLDYLESLGVTALWLLPFYPSPLKDDGYDISDYFSVNAEYGDLRDFRLFLKEAHRRGLRVITELVINHTSDQHPWFQRARRAKAASVYRDFYVWSETPEQYRDVRVIFQDYESSNWAWDGQAKAYYWHRFYSHQPDLNFANARVRKEIFRVLDFWFGMGVDGMRLDAVPYLFEREGTNCENLEETHEFLRSLRAHVDAHFEDRLLLAEANQWPEDAAAYFGRGDECHMAFHFPVMPRLFMAVRMEDRFPIMDILEQTPEIPSSCQWAMFLRNHDELTLEMVTDEERDYMYRVYAQDRRMRVNVGIRRRLAPLLGNDRRKVELLKVLLFSLPGTPVVYYGDEMGMGDNYYLGDRDGVRTPMQWSPDRNAGFSTCNPQQLFLPVIVDSEYHYAAINVENQERNPSSMLWWMRRLIAARKSYRAFGRGTIRFVNTENAKVLAFIREYEQERILVVANLSGASQAIAMDLAEYAGYVPEEMFSGNAFWPIESGDYVLTLGPYDFYWFILRAEGEGLAGVTDEGLVELTARGGWLRGIPEEDRRGLEKVLAGYICRQRWLGGKSRQIRRVRVAESVPVAAEPEPALLLRLEVTYREGPGETYLLPVTLASRQAAVSVMQEHPEGAICWVTSRRRDGLLYDGVHSEAFRAAILEAIMGRKRLSAGKAGAVRGVRGRELRRILDGKEGALESHVLKVEQSNTSVVYGESLFFKLYRRLEEGVNPDLEISRCLTEQTGFRNFPAYAGSLERARDDTSWVLGMLLRYEPNQGNAWTYMLDAVDRYFSQALALKEELEGVEGLETVERAPKEVTTETIAEELRDLIGVAYLEMGSLLGRRTAEFHLAMASLRGPAMEPEPFTKLYQRSVYQSMWGALRQGLRALRRGLDSLPEEVRAVAAEVSGWERQMLESLERIKQLKISALKIRIHGDYHLGQVLFTGKDFILIDFEGEPARPLSERRLKRSALRDVAGMIRSFHYAAYGAIFLRTSLRGGGRESLERWAERWYACMSGVFLSSYVKAMGASAVVPQEREEFDALLQAFLLDKAIYEVGYELNHRPDWLMIPIRGIERIVKRER